jgi:hypothetical protein
MVLRSVLTVVFVVTLVASRDVTPASSAPSSAAARHLSSSEERYEARPVLRVLRPGSRGPAVERLSRRLSSLGYLPRSAVGPYYGEALRFAVVAFQKQEGLTRDGEAGREVWRRLERAQRPRPRFHRSGRALEVSLSRQLVYLVRNGRVEQAIAVSSGANGRTPVGSYRIYRKERMSWSVPFSVWMPWASYFVGGIAFHSYRDVPSYPASHGCVRVAPPFAKRLYFFAPIGTPVTVYP